MNNFLSDVRFALRGLAKAPGFAAVAILTLALGIGACTAIFSVVNGVLLQPQPYDQADRIVVLRGISKEGNPMGNMPDQVFRDWQEGTHSFESMAHYNSGEGSVAGGSEPVRVSIGGVSQDFFKVLRVRPLLGRLPRPEEHKYGAAPVAVVSFGFWKRILGGDPDFASKQLRSGGYNFTVVGVLPDGFRFPARVEVWAPGEIYNKPNPSRSAHNWRMIARLNDGITLTRAVQDLSQITRRVHAESNDMTAVDATAVPFGDAVTAQIRPALLLLLGAVGSLLLIACANVVNMLLARATAQEKEFAVRAALGASRWRLVQQCVTESLVLALAGAGLGAVLAAWGVDALLALGQGQIPRSDNVSVNLVVLGFALALSVVTSLLLGFIPGWRASRLALASVMNESGRGGSSGGSQKQVRSILVVAQVALTLVLLVGAGLLARSFGKVMAVDLGFQRENRLSVDMRMAFPRTPDEERSLREFAAQFEEKLKVMPGVVSLGGSNAPPLSPSGGNGRFKIEGRGDSGNYWPQYRVASPGYFKTLGVPLIRGRLFDDTDGAQSPQVAVISRDVAEKAFPNEDPIGKRINTGNMDGDEKWMTVVGIVADVKENGPEQDSGGAIYTHYLQRGGGGGIARFNWLLHTTTESAALIPAIRDAVRSLNPDVAPKFQTLEQSFQSATASRRFNFTLLAVFAGVALGLAGLGIYGVLAYSVEQRTREIGIRMALGAQPGQVIGMVLSQGGRLLLIGVVVGLFAAYWASTWLRAMLFQTSAADPMTYGVVCAFLGLVSVMACLAPARHAAKVDPIVALRHD